MTPLRVAVDATPLLGPRTGVGEFTDGLLRALARSPDLDLAAYGLTWRGRGRFADLLPSGVRARTRPIPARPMRAVWARAPWPPIEWWVGPVDVVHGTNFVVPPARRAATLVTVHDLTPVRFPEMVDAPSLAYPKLIEEAVRRGAWVHTDSAFVAGEVVDVIGVPADRVVASHPGLPSMPPGNPEQGRRLAGAPRFVLTVGTVEPRKDHPLLVRAFDRVAAIHPDVRLVIAGPDGWGADALDEASAGAAHRDRIVRVGWVTADDRAALLAAATVFAFPSRYEGFGFPPLEAMRAGVPVVATVAGSLPEVLGDAAVLVPTSDEEALAAAIARLLDDGEERSRLVTAGRDQAARYSWERCADEITALYRRAAEDR